MEVPGNGNNNGEHDKHQRSKYQRKYPDYFPGTVKQSGSVESHLFFCALACVQESLAVIPKAEKLFSDIITQLDQSGCRKVSEVINANVTTYAHTIGRVAALTLQKKRYSVIVNQLVLLLKILRLLPFFIFNKDVWNLMTSIRGYIVESFNRNPSKPEITLGIKTGVLIIATTIAAQFSLKNIDPYKYDRNNSPLRAEMALSRPKTRKGRKLKSEYNKMLRDLGFKRSFDKYYTYGAKKWLLARVICPSAAEAAKRLQISWEQLYKDLTEFDIAMGYPRGK